MNKPIHLLIFLLFQTLITACAIKESNEDLSTKYLNNPQTSQEIKNAIKNGIVILGMCPFEAFAAAGYPGPYMVKRDPAKWEKNVPPPTIIQAQCEHPDSSTIELMFKNQTQFKTSEPMQFRVRFINGKAVLIDQKGFNE